MITDKGKVEIKKFLAQQVSTFGGSVAFGIGAAAESNSDLNLQFEIDRADISLVSYDFTNNNVIFKASIPSTYEGTIYEVGLYNKTGQPQAKSSLITTFDPIAETWTTGGVPATFSATNARVGANGLSHTPSASGNTVSQFTNSQISLLSNLGTDLITFAFYNTNANVSSIVFRFKTDSTNYYSITLTSPAVGYNFTSVAKGTATPTGSPDWGTVHTVEVQTNSGAGGASNVMFDAIRITDSSPSELILVSREVLSTPFVKINGMVQEVEFNLAVTI